MSGPIRKRDEERVRRNKDGIPTETVHAIGCVSIPDLNIPGAHQLVVDIYESLRESAQNRFFEPSDWHFARLTMYVLNEELQSGRVGAMKLSAINQMLSSLLVTEGDRRRVRMEVERNQAPSADVVSIADVYRQRLGG